MSVVDLHPLVSQSYGMITHDALLEELIARLSDGRVTGVAVAKALGVTSSRVTEMKKRRRLIQQHEMPILIDLFKLTKSSDLPSTNATPVAFDEESLSTVRENLHVLGSSLGPERHFGEAAIELTRLNIGDVVDRVRRPAILNGKAGAYALYIHGSSMHPALPDGEMVVAVKDMPLRTGDYVVVYLNDEAATGGDQSDGVLVLVKELVRRTASTLELRQYFPNSDFSIDMKLVSRIDRVLTRREMLS